MRSMLFLPADSEKKIAKGDDTHADGLILDLEDSVASERRPIAREMTTAFIAELAYAGVFTVTTRAPRLSGTNAPRGSCAATNADDNLTPNLKRAARCVSRDLEDVVVGLDRVDP